MHFAHYRQAALKVFNEWRLQFNWQVSEYKMQLILFPGGVEFMKLIHHISNLAMGAIVKRAHAPTAVP